jgi:tRNA A-37 threonylcarbamoyl transferase component Bud32
MGETALSGQIQSPKFHRQIVQDEALNLRRIWKKSQRKCSDFQKVCEQKKTLIHQRNIDPTLVAMLQTQPDELMEMGKRLKSGNTCTVQQVDWAGSNIVVKRYNPKPLSYRVRHYFQMSRAMRSWSNGIVMNQLGIPTALPLVVLEERESGLLKRSYLIMEQFQGESLYLYLNKLDLRSEEFERVIVSLVQLFTRLKGLKAVHGDLKAKNILVNANQVCLIDTDGLRLLVSPYRFRRAFKSDFKRLLNNWPHDSKVREKIATRLADVFEA